MNNKTNIFKRLLLQVYINIKNKELCMYNICGVAVTIIGSGFYNIIISKDYEIYNLKKYDYCQVNNSIIKKVDNTIWKSILSK
jgi:hypothetical protein